MPIIVVGIIGAVSVIFSIVYMFILYLRHKPSDKIWPGVATIPIALVCIVFMSIATNRGENVILSEVESGSSTYQLVRITDKEEESYYLIQNGSTLKYLYEKDGKILSDEVGIENVNIHIEEDADTRIVIHEKTVKSRTEYMFFYGFAQENDVYEFDIFVPNGNAIAYNGRIGDE